MSYLVPVQQPVGLSGTGFVQTYWPIMLLAAGAGLWWAASRKPVYKLRPTPRTWAVKHQHVGGTRQIAGFKSYRAAVMKSRQLKDLDPEVIGPR